MPTNTLASLEALVYDGLDQNSGMYPEPNLRAVLNQGIWRMNLLTAFSQSTVPVPGFTQAGKLIYAVPPSVVIPLRVYCEGRELSKCSLRQLSATYRNWSVDTTTNLGPVARWAPIDTTSFVIHPVDALGGSLLEVEGIASIAAMVNPADPAAVEDEFADIAVDYGRSRTRLKLTAKPFSDASVAYQGMVKKLKFMLAWETMRFPRYWVEQPLEPSEGKGA